MTLSLEDARVYPFAGNGSPWRILLQKSFWGGERKFLGPLTRFTQGDVRDHIVSSKIDHELPVVALKSDAAAEKSKDQLSRDF